MYGQGFVPTQIVEGDIQLIKEVLSSEGKNTVLICSKHLITQFNLELSMSEQMIWVERPKGYPNINHIRSVIHKIGKEKVNRIIAIGGGSCIDLAKALCIFLSGTKRMDLSEADIREVIKNQTYINEKILIELVAVPTTSGTGAELTRWGTIWDIEEKKKYSIEDSRLYAKTAYIVPELTVGLPKKLTIATGLDAFAHACEAYWSNRSNCIIRNIALRSMELIMEYLPKLTQRIDDLNYRKQLSVASVLAAIAFSQTKTTACHSISYPLTLHYNIEHGFAVAMTLNQVYQRNYGHFEGDTELGLLFARFDGLDKWIESVAGNQIKLSYWNVTKEMIPQIASESISKGRMDNNPIVFTIEEVESILNSII